MITANFAAEWLAGLDARPKTIQAYTWAVRHGVEVFGKVQVQTVRADHIQALMHDMESLSPASRRLAWTVWYMVFEAAIVAKRRTHNPMVAIIRPRAVRRLAYLTPEQAKKLLRGAGKDRWEALYRLAVSTGMRLGELLGLIWDDVDLDRATLSISHQIGELGGKISRVEVKTEASRRCVSLSEGDIRALQRQRSRVKSWIPWVFPNVKGDPMNPRNLTQKEFRPLCRELGLPDVPFHGLRHTAVTLMAALGIPVSEISSRVGHADIGTTMRIYRHVLDGYDRGAAKAMGDLLG